MVRVEAKEVYGVDLGYSKVAIMFGASADVNVDYKIELNNGEVKVDLSLKGTFVETQLLGKKHIKGKALKELEAMYSKDIQDLVRKERGVDSIEIGNLFFNFENYLKRISDFDKFDKFLKGKIKKFVRLDFDFLEELSFAHNVNITKDLNATFGKIEFVYVPELNVEFGILFKQGNIFVPKRVFNKYVKQLRQRAKNGGKQV